MEPAFNNWDERVRRHISSMSNSDAQNGDKEAAELYDEMKDILKDAAIIKRAGIELNLSFSNISSITMRQYTLCGIVFLI